MFIYIYNHDITIRIAYKVNIYIINGTDDNTHEIIRENKTKFKRFTKNFLQINSRSITIRLSLLTMLKLTPQTI